MEPSALVSESHSPLESQSLSLISSSSSKNFSRTSSESFALAHEMKPQRPSDAVVGAVSATAAVGALGGDPSSSISLVMLALLTCSHDPPVSVATYFVSLFFGLGNVAMALGNIGLAMGVILLHFFGALILAKVSPSALVHAVDGPAPRGAFDRFLPVASMCYFPSQSVKVLIMLLPGSVLGGVAGTIRGVSGGDVAACAVAILLDVALFSALVLVQQRVVLPRSEYVRYPQQYSVGYTVEKTVLFPSARWEPRHMRQSFQPLLTAVAEGFSPLIFADLFLACLIGIVSGSYVGGACDTPLLAVAAALYFLACIVFAVLRPHRLPMDRISVPVNYLLMGCICALKYSDPTNSASSTIQMIVSGVQIWRTGWSVFVTMYREPQLRDDDEPHNNALHSTIHQAQEKEAFYDDNIEFGGNDEELFPLHHHDDVVVGVEDAMNVVDAKIKCDDDGGALEGGLFWDADGNARTQPRGGRPNHL